MSLKLVQQNASSTTGIGEDWDQEKFRTQVKGLSASRTYMDVLDFMLSVPGGKDWLAEYLSTNIQLQPEIKAAGMVRTMGLTDKQSADAKVTVAGFLFYFQITLETGACGGKNSIIRAGGLGTVGGGVYYGKLWYDNCSDFDTEGSDVQYNLTPGAGNLNFIRDGYTFAFFVGGGVSTISSIGGGRVTW